MNERNAIRVCISGATGWVGRALVEHVRQTTDLVVTGAVARSSAGKDLGEVISGTPSGVRIEGRIENALAASTDVVIEYSSSLVALHNVLYAIDAGVHVVIGTSGLTAADYATIEARASERGVGVIAAGNFSLTAALLKHFAVLAARHLGDREIIDYADGQKLDVPSGTVQEIAEAIDGVGPAPTARPIASLNGPAEARGVAFGATRVHSLRLPGFVIGVDVIYAASGERLILRHEAGSSPAPYVAGTLLAVRRVSSVRGLVRGFDKLLFSANHDA